MDENGIHTLRRCDCRKHGEPLVRRRETVGFELPISRFPQITQLPLRQIWEGDGALEVADEKPIPGLPQRVPLPFAQVLGLIVENVFHRMLVMDPSQHQASGNWVEADKSMGGFDPFRIAARLDDQKVHTASVSEFGLSLADCQARSNDLFGARFGLEKDIPLGLVVFAGREICRLWLVFAFVVVSSCWCRFLHCSTGH